MKYIKAITNLEKHYRKLVYLELAFWLLITVDFLITFDPVIKSLKIGYIMLLVNIVLCILSFTIVKKVAVSNYSKMSEGKDDLQKMTIAHSYFFGIVYGKVYGWAFVLLIGVILQRILPSSNIKSLLSILIIILSFFNIYKACCGLTFSRMKKKNIIESFSKKEK